MPGDSASETGRWVEERSGHCWVDRGVRGQVAGVQSILDEYLEVVIEKGVDWNLKFQRKCSSK